MLTADPTTPQESEPLASAFASHLSGELADAESIYESIGADEPQYIFAIMHLAAIRLAQNRSAEAWSLYRSLFAQADGEIIGGLERAADGPDGLVEEAWLTFAAASLHEKRDTLAEAVLGRLVNLRPKSADARNNLGILLLATDRAKEAIPHLQVAVDVSPQWGTAWFNLGRALGHSGDSKGAVLKLETALRLDPSNLTCRVDLAGTLIITARRDEAIEHLRVIVRESDNVATLDNTALRLLLCQAREASREAFAKAEKIDPQDCIAAIGLSVFLFENDDVMPAEKKFRDAVSRLPRDANALVHLVEIFESHLPRSALRLLMEKAIDSSMDDGKVLGRIAHLSHVCRYGDLALRAYKRVVELDVGHRKALAHLLDVQLSVCEWADFDDLAEDIRAEVSRTIAAGDPLEIDVWNLFAIGVDYSELARAARYKSAQISASSEEARKRSGFTFKRSARDRIRLGYLCPYTWKSSHIDNLDTVISRHDHSRFELFGYTIQAPHDEEFDRQFMDGFDEFRTLSARKQKEGARKVYQDEIDILIDTTGHFAASCMVLCAMRPAPLILHGTAGFNIIGGAEFYDYSLNDRHYLPDNLVKYYVESPVHMPHSAMPAESRPIDSLPAQRSVVGLPEDKFIFVDFNHPCKFDPVVFDAWMAILDRVPDSILLLCQWIDGTAESLRKVARARGVDPERIVFGTFLKHSQHLRRLQLCDLALDTYYHTGGVTTLDCLVAGLPMVTAIPDRELPLANVSLFTATDLGDLVQPDLQQYVETAVALANDPKRLAALRARFQENRERAPLLQTERWVRNLERGYELMFEAYLRGDPPAPFSILDVEQWSGTAGLR